MKQIKKTHKGHHFFPKGMSFGAGLLNLGCCKNWREQIDFPNAWNYNFSMMRWEQKEPKQVIKFGELGKEANQKVALKISDRDLLYAI